MSRKQPPRLVSKRNITCSFSSNKTYFDCNDALPQKLLIPNTILTYVVQKLRPKTIFKVTKTCKFLKRFCDNRRGRVIDALWISPKLHYDFTNSMIVQIHDNSPIFNQFITGICIEERILCDCCTDPSTAPKIVRLSRFCSVRDLYMEYQRLTSDELEKLGRNARSFLVSRLEITDVKSDEGMLKIIMERIPNAAQIE